MTGLENIIKQIELDAKGRADEVVAKAKAEAEKIIGDAKAKADAVMENFKEQAASQAKETLERGKAADEIDVKRASLKKKQDLIGKAISKAKNEIKEAKAEEYFAFLAEILNKNAQEKSGRVILAAKDLEEITADFKKALEEKGLAAEGGSIASRNGFIIVYGSIEINCTIDALFEAHTEEISDSLNELFFGSEGGN